MEKSGRKKYQKYTEEKVRKALDDVDKGMSIHAAAIAHSIPRATLLRKSKGGILATKTGPSTVLSEEHEAIIVFWIKTMAKALFPVTKENLLYSVDKLASEIGVTFAEGKTRPGRKWYECFRKRHPQISDRTSQNLTARRRDVKQEDLDKWFNEADSYIKEKQLQAAFENPKRIFNTDETAFFLNPKPGKVLAEKGVKNVYTAAGSDEKENLTVLVTANAAGQLAPPMIVYRYARIPANIAQSVPLEWAMGRSENGWMTQETFYEYMTNIFEPWLSSNNIPRPVVFLMDGHTSHISLPLSNFCLKHKIELVALFPNATHLIQPMDVAVFHTLKATWRQKVSEWRMSNDGKQILKHVFAPVLKAVMDELSQKTISNGFKACGIMPWDPQKVKIQKKSTEPEIKTDRSTEKQDLKIFLRVLQRKIGEEKLNTFKICQGEWKRPIEDSGLYAIWKDTTDQLHLGVLSQVAFAETTPPTVRTPSLSSTPQNIKLNVTPLTEQPGPSYAVTQTPADVGMGELSNTGEPESKSDLPIIPSPFKRAFLWPVQTAPQKKRTKEKIPAVCTSPSMLTYYKKKEEVKQKKKKKKKEEESNEKRRKKSQGKKKNRDRKERKTIT